MLQNFALQLMETSKRYNSVPVKDNCALFAPTPIFAPWFFLRLWRFINHLLTYLLTYFRARAIRRCHLNFSPADSCCHGNKFWDKIDYSSAPVKDNWSLFAPTPYFWVRAIRWCHLNFFPADPSCYGNEFLDKIDYNSAPAKDNCTLFSHTPYFRARAMQ